jgi:hypothetical protein
MTDVWWWIIHLKANSPESEGLQQGLFQIRVDVEDFILAYGRILSNYSYCVENFEPEEYDLAKVDNGHTEYYQALRDQDVRREEQIQGKREFMEAAFGAKV